MYEDLVKRLRDAAKMSEALAVLLPHSEGNATAKLYKEAADAIEELIKVASAMHTWIFLHTGDEQAAYDECGLTDEMNAELGYGGQYVIEPPKEE